MRQKNEIVLYGYLAVEPAKLEHPPASLSLTSVSMPGWPKGPEQALLLFYGGKDATRLLHLKRIEIEKTGQLMVTVEIRVDIAASVIGRVTLEEQAKSRLLSLKRLNTDALRTCRAYQEKYLREPGGQQKWQDPDLFTRTRHACTSNIRLVERLAGEPPFDHCDVVTFDVTDPSSPTKKSAIALLRRTTHVTEAHARGLSGTSITMQ